MSERDALLARDLGVTRVERTELLVLGSGVAGLSVALGAAPSAVTLVTKSVLVSGSSPWAQGGMAAAVGEDDDWRLHAEDTERVARGLGDVEAIRQLTEAAPRVVERLLELGTRFDLDETGDIALGREGGHSRHRILHAGGDKTGREIVRALAQAVREAEHVDVRERAFAVDLLVGGSSQDERVHGAVLLMKSADGSSQDRVAVLSDAVVLATGGLGQLYRRTTNPPEVTGDGVAMAARAGARLVDLEFVQFHPTALAMDVPAGELSKSPLLTEALRGAGAWLVDEKGRRFVRDQLSEGELAPRDEVARAIWRHRDAGHETFLVVSHIRDLARRFPTLMETCEGAGIDPLKEGIPVSPAAHYAMGGVMVDDQGRSSLEGLFACGEASSTGVHGANRLASNSLLEGLVFGARVARTATGIAGRDAALSLQAESSLRVAGERPRAPHASPSEAASSRDVSVLAELRELMWRRAGLIRERLSMVQGLSELSELTREASAGWRDVENRAEGELRNLMLLSRLVLETALRREESRGSHFRVDCERTLASFRRRLPCRLEGGRLVFETPLASVRPDAVAAQAGRPGARQ